jgi:hypothetical protein
VPTGVLGVYLFKLAFPPEEIHLYFTLNEEIVILTDDPFSILVTDCNAEVDKISVSDESALFCDELYRDMEVSLFVYNFGKLC